MIQCVYLRILTFIPFLNYDLFFIMIYDLFYISLPYSTTNAQSTKEQLEQPNYADNNSAQRYKF